MPPGPNEPDPLTDELDALFERMQSAEARDAAEALFSVTPEELGRAAVEAARRRSER